MRLLPRQEKFFHFFNDQAVIMVDVAELLLDGVRNGNSAMAAKAERITRRELEADAIIHDIYQRLKQTFITPIDPEDIHRLSSLLDDVIDLIEDSSYRLVAYNLTPVPPAVVRLVEILLDAVRMVQKAVAAIEKHHDVLRYCIEINRLEDEADAVFRKAISDLFREEKDPVSLLKQKEVLESIEAAADRCEDVADCIQSIIVKNS